MSGDQERRLKTGSRASKARLSMDDVRALDLQELRAYEDMISDGIVALQSTDYVGSKDRQAEVDAMHDKLQAHVREVRALLEEPAAHKKMVKQTVNLLQQVASERDKAWRDRTEEWQKSVPGDDYAFGTERLGPIIKMLEAWVVTFAGC